MTVQIFTKNIRHFAVKIVYLPLYELKRIRLTDEQRMSYVISRLRYYVCPCSFLNLIPSILLLLYELSFILSPSDINLHFTCLLLAQRSIYGNCLTFFFLSRLLLKNFRINCYFLSNFKLSIDFLLRIS